MKYACTLTLSALTSIIFSASASPFHTREQTSIEWKECDTVGNTPVPVTCGTLAVPLDYTKPDSTETLDLKLVRHRATKEPFKGSILFNPGGPGYAGRNLLTASIDVVRAIIGSQHDVVAWDYRGTGETLPFSCFASEVERSAYSSSLSDIALNASDVALGEAWATQKMLTDICAESKNATAVGELIGTVFTARDMMRIVDALGEDGLLRLWGISYGTALGEVAAAMFPDRMDKLILDAVLNPNQYWHGSSVSQISGTDATFHEFLTECVKVPKLCPLASHLKKDTDLSEQMYELFENVKYHPVVFGSLGIQTYAMMKTTIMGLLYTPRSSYPSLGKYLAAMLTRNETLFLEYALASVGGSSDPPPFPEFSSAGTKENTQGIRCSDEELRSDDLDSVMPLLGDWLNVSRVAGDVTPLSQTVLCAQWPFKAKERYTAGFENIKTKNPVLFVANTFDPITSIDAARNASAAFLDSRLLLHDGHGHAILSQPSPCTARAIRRYLNDGTLPEDSIVCPSSYSPFTAISDDELYELLASDD